MPLDENASDTWPFEAWLKLGVQSFGLSPKVFWETGFRDWRSLIAQNKSSSMNRIDFDALLHNFPDRNKENE